MAYLSSTGKSENSTDSPADHLMTEAEGIEQNVVILMERDQEINLNQLEQEVEREAQSELESLPVLLNTFTTEYPVNINQTGTPDTTESFPSTTYATHLLQPVNENVEGSYHSQLPLEAINSTISTTETYDSTQGTAILPGDYNGTELHQNLSFTSHLSVFESSTYKAQTESQTMPDTNPTESLQSLEQTTTYQDIQETGPKFDKNHTDYSETESNHTHVAVEGEFLEGTTLTVGPSLQVKLNDASAENPVQMLITTQASQYKGTSLTQETPTAESAIETYSVWTLVDGSGDIFHGRETRFIKTRVHELASYLKRFLNDIEDFPADVLA